MLLDILPYQLRTETFASAELTRQKKLWSLRWKGQKKKVKYNFDYTDIHTHWLVLKREQPAQILKKRKGAGQVVLVSAVRSREKLRHRRCLPRYPWLCANSLAAAACTEDRLGVGQEGSGSLLTHWSSSFIAFLYSASPTSDKYFQIPYFILLFMQSLRMQICQ